MLALRPRWVHPSGAMIADYSATAIPRFCPTAGFIPAVGVMAAWARQRAASEETSASRISSTFNFLFSIAAVDG